ncbi:hypothetical protein V5799_021474 [Amblyomma americanum]|uniref:Sulfatase N-terminal domain-containing protein n=1 Tax=Amblyomma americanum TaxID=6943 RepID=A0AAQ4FNF3_AMBAM
MDGVVLANNYVQPLCTPSRSALLTGFYPIHTGTQHSSFRSADPVGLDPDLKLLPEYLKDLGYSTHIVGKTSDLATRNAGSLAELDNAVGAIVESLYKTGLLNNTVIAFSTDNGGAPVGFSRNTSPNWPLRGSKGTVAEGGVRGPGFLWTPWLATRTKATRQLFHITDWLPSFYAAAGGRHSYSAV